MTGFVVQGHKLWYTHLWYMLHLININKCKVLILSKISSFRIFFLSFIYIND